jgi:hypothetical protein
MLSIFDAPTRLCDGLSRREILRAGSLGALGLAAPFGRFALASPPRGDAPARACIVLFLLGGPPQHSTWDPKPLAPAEVRGNFGVIPTNVPGIQICELLPRMAQVMDKVALLRAVVTGDNAHSSSGYYMMTGVPHVPMNMENANPGAPNDWPTMGAVLQHLATGTRLLPPSVRLPMHIYNTDGSVWPGQDSGWLGHAADPWLFRCEPASPDFDVPQFRLQADVTLGRLSNRRSLLDQLETQLREVDRGATNAGRNGIPSVSTRDVFRQDTGITNQSAIPGRRNTIPSYKGALATYADRERQAFDLLSSAQARAACDLKQEPPEVRERYGNGQFGQSVLLARRLVESGVKFVQVNWFRGADEPAANPCWDSHVDETNRLKNVLVPPLDQAYSALLTDLAERGLLDETLVVCMAEFGRSPKLDGNGGRGHWGSVFSVALSGGGIKGGQVHGASDDQAAYPREGIVHPQDLTATIFDRLGYSPETQLHDAFGRPLPISRGDVIEAIV